MGLLDTFRSIFSRKKTEKRIPYNEKEAIDGKRWRVDTKTGEKYFFEED